MNLTLNLEKQLDAVIDRDACVNCDSCGSVCPVGAIREREREVEGLKIPDPEKLPAASTGCPLGIVPQVLAEYLKSGRVEDAATYLYKKNPLAALTAQVCDQFCQETDRRKLFGGAPVNLPAMERYLVDKVASKPQEYAIHYKERVAVIGGGPAGLAAAHELASRGYEVTILEKDKALGGTMAWGIPGFRLDKDKMDAEIAKIVTKGINVETGVDIGTDTTLEELREKYDAIVLAAGASEGATLNFEGTDGDMVLDGVTVLRTINLEPENEFTAVGDRVVVIGGGRFAVDVSRTLARKGKEVTCVAMEEQDKLQIPEEIQTAMAAEGIVLKAQAAPRRIVRNNGQITEVEFGRVKMGLDREGKNVPIITDEDDFYVVCDTVVFAVGRKFKTGEIGEFSAFADGAVQTDQYNRTSQEKVFACGDVTGATNSVVEAIASGKQAARNVDAFLRGRQFPSRHATFVRGSDETITQEEIAMIRPQKEEVIFSRSGSLTSAPAEDLMGMIRQAGIPEEEPEAAGADLLDGKKVRKVAVVGGGLAGIAAAIELKKRGYAPTIFEKSPFLGGRYRWQSTNKRVDVEGFDQELAKLEAMGIDVVCNASAGIKPSISELKADGFGAILFTIGESRGIRPDIPGAYSVGVFELVSLISRLSRDIVINSIGGSVIVAGSDAMAVDAARKLKEYAKDVTLICRCTREQLEAAVPAIADALEEGVNLVTGTELVGIESRDGTVQSAELRIMGKDLVINVPCNTLVIGDTQEADTATIIARNPALKADERGAFITNERLETPIRGVLSVGNFDVTSVVAGEAGAAAVDAFFTGEEPDLSILAPKTDPAYPPDPSQMPPHEIIEGKTMADKGFEVGRRLLTTKQVKQEAARLLCVGYHQVDSTRCIGCGICVRNCPEAAIELVACREVE